MYASLSSVSYSLAAEHDALRQAGLFRVRRTIDSPQGPIVTVDGRTAMNFCSNDYLGLANHPRLIKITQQALEKYGLGSGASQLICGRSSAHAALEEQLARITGRDRALVFSSGYLANLSVITAYCNGREDLIIEDHLNHASMIDGAQLARARLTRYRHADAASLVKRLEKKGIRRKLVLTEGVFSMDGDIAPLAEIISVCNRAGVCLAVDDAHGFGVLGETGRGTLEHLGIDQHEVPVLVATFGKALGACGAFVAGTEVFIETLIQRARPYIYTTAMPPALCVAVTEGLHLLEEETWRRDQLHNLIRRFRQGAQQLDLPLGESITPIQPLLIGAADKAARLSEKLLQQNILISAIRPPTVPENSSRLRITLSAAHTEEQIDLLLDTLSSCLQV